MIPLRLEWRRPADGMDVYLDGSGRKFWDMKTDRFELVSVERVDLENPVVLQFINDNRAGKLERFVNRFGFPREWPFDHVAAQHEAVRLLGSLISLSVSASPQKRAGAVRMVLDALEVRPVFDETGGRFVLQASDLMGFMAMEVVHAHDAGVALTQCAHCQKYFLTGPKTNRRSTATYCSDRCRVAAMRARNLGKE